MDCELSVLLNPSLFNRNRAADKLARDFARHIKIVGGALKL